MTKWPRFGHCLLEKIPNNRQVDDFRKTQYASQPSPSRSAIPDSATSQFFINANNNDFLNYPGQDGWGYCVFGKVTDGTDVVDKIQKVATGNSGGHQDVPREPVIILNVIVD